MIATIRIDDPASNTVSFTGTPAQVLEYLKGNDMEGSSIHLTITEDDPEEIYAHLTVLSLTGPFPHMERMKNASTPRRQKVPRHP